MAYSSVVNDVRKCINFEKPSRLPVFALTEEFDVAQAGLTYEQYYSSAETVAKTHIQGIEKFDYDWSCVYIDDCLEYEPLGVKTVGKDNIPRSALEFLPATYTSLNRLRMPEPDKDGRMPILLGAIEMISRQFKDNIFLCGRSPAPFSAVTLLYGVEATMLLMYDNPQLLSDTMNFLADIELLFAQAQINKGAKGLWIGDCSASSRFISTEHYKKFVLEPTSDYIRKIRSLGAITIYFSAEKSLPHFEITTQLGADVIALSEDADIQQCMKTGENRVCLMGNLDPINILYNGTPETVKNEIKRIICDAGMDKGYLFNTGEGVPRDTDSHNIRALVKALRNEWK